MIPHCNDNVEIQALERPIMTASAPFGVVCLFVCFLSMMGLLHWLCGWDQCHAEKRSRCQSHAFQMVLYGG